MKVFMLALAIGFPLAVIFAWAFKMTSDGIKFNCDPRFQALLERFAVPPLAEEKPCD